MNTIMKFKKTTRLAVALTVLLVSACSFEVSTEKTDGDITPEDYRCTSDQLNLVKKEYAICTETEYLSSFCFAQAKKTQCELIKRAQPAAQGN